MLVRHLAALSTGCLLLGAATTAARAEGTAQLGTSQALRSGTVMYVDIVDPTVESIRWTGVGTATLYGPTGASLGTLTSGTPRSLVGLPVGAYRLVNASQQTVGGTWDVAVINQTDGAAARGRLYSYNWTFDANSYAQANGTSGSFYAIVDGGTASHKPVIELALHGLAGYIWDMNANAIGVAGPNRGRSVPVAGNSVTPQYPIYLRPPTIATYDQGTASVAGLDFIGGTSTSAVTGAEIDPCNQVAPGQSEGQFMFQSQVTGSYHVQCDLDRDGAFSESDPDDLLLIGPLSIGANVVSWNGVHRGLPVTPGQYDCQVTTTVGEFHYVGRDIETSYRGMRMYEVRADLTRRPLRMFWDDTAVQAAEVNMPNGVRGLVTPGPDGMLSAPYGATPTANVDARAWGNFTGAGKGNDSFLDTYVWLAESTSSQIELRAADVTVDTDGDGLSDFAEECTIGSNPESRDSDDDGTPDGEEYGNGSTLAENGGLESNGRLATALAQRAILGTRLGHKHAGPGATDLAVWFDGVALAGATARASTPSDLPSVTNASLVRGVDFVAADGRVRGSALVIATDGELYEHSKEICDRAHGAVLDLVSSLVVDGQPLVQSRFQRAQDGKSDHAVALKLYDTGAGFALHGGWLAESFPAAAAGQRVLNVQIWGATGEDLASLTTAFLQRWRALGLTAAAVAPAPVADEAWTPAASTSTSAAPAAPAAFFRAGTLLGERLDVEVQRRTTEDALRLRLVGADALGREQTVDLGPVTAQRTLPVGLDLALYTDVTVELVGPRGVEDRMWLSDGAWSRFDDGLWGGDTAPATTVGCTEAQAGDALPGAVIRLAGCARMDAASVDTLAGVARHLERPLDARRGAYLAAHVATSRGGFACLESSALRLQSCRYLPAHRGWVAWSTAGFDPMVAAQADLVSFYTTTGGATTVAVHGLSLVTAVPAGVLDASDLAPEVTQPTDPEPTAPTVDETSGGCSSAPSPGAASALALLGLAMAATLRRRKRAVAR